MGVYKMENQYDNDYKKWTILIYIAGNNDLEPYIYQQFQLLKEVVNKQAHIMIQISRAKREILHSNEPQSNELHPWSGTRRYMLYDNQVILLEDLGQVNMADPTTLFDFLIWGSNRSSSEKTMLIMSGHSAGFVGLMKESTKRGNALMSIQGFTKVIRLFTQRSKRIIDLLIMDTCFMDSVEIWYQLCMDGLRGVKYALVPHDNTRLCGIPYHNIINILLRNCKKELQADFRYKHILNEVNQIQDESHLFCIQLQKDNFIKLKDLINAFSKIALDYGRDITDVLLKNSLYKQK